MSAPLYERITQQLPNAPEPSDQSGDPRSAPAKDRDRIIHSGALRRLQRKSQIVGVQSNDFFRTRLTHTLECAQIGRGLAHRATNTPDIATVVEQPEHLPDLLEAACLAHDLGHPPFGHNGEAALQAQMRKRAGGLFEGNAQSMRIVTRLEPKVFVGVPFGLDLCATTLRAIVKYPNAEKQPGGRPGHPKFCFYDDPHEDGVVAWLYGGQPMGSRTLAAEMLEAADDIAYAAHDFEDGVWSGMIPLWQLHQDVGNARAKLTTRAEADKDNDGLFMKPNTVEKTLVDLLAPAANEPWLKEPFDRGREARAGLKNFCARLINDLIEAVTPGLKFQVPLPKRTERRIATLKAMAREWMIEDPGQATVRYGQRRLVEDLFEGYWDDPLRPRDALGAQRPHAMDHRESIRIHAGRREQSCRPTGRRPSHPQVADSDPAGRTSEADGPQLDLFSRGAPVYAGPPPPAHEWPPPPR